MSTFGEDTDLLVPAPRAAKVAFCAACGDRVAPVFNEYWVGSPSDEVLRAVKLGWEFACTGLVDRESVASCRAELADIVAYYHEEDIAILAQAVTTCLRVVECIGADGEESAARASARASGACLYVALLADNYINLRVPIDNGPAELEEMQWQTLALGRTSTWTGPCSRGMFADIGPTPPVWWATYQAAPEHI